MRAEAFYLPVDGGLLGQRMCVLRAPPAGVSLHGLVVHASPLAEEMNKSRRMVAVQTRALAQAGFATLQIDLLGCGDSAGEFSDASWPVWVDDMVFAANWLRAEQATRWPGAGTAPLWLWGLRAGCLLATAAAARLDSACHLLFWQPSASGRTLLQQFLRLRSAGAMLAGKSGGADTARADLAAGKTVDVAGYGLSPGLATGLESAALLAPPRAGQMEWIEISTRTPLSLSPAAAQPLAAWQQAGWSVHAQAVGGPPFWQTTEIEEAPALVTATTNALLRAAGPRPESAQPTEARQLEERPC